MEEEPKWPITPAWLQRYKVAFDALPQGEKQRVADYAGCSPALLSRIAAGQEQSSRHLVKISERLGIARPAVAVNSELQAKIAEASEGLSEEDQETVLSMVKRLRR